MDFFVGLLTGIGLAVAALGVWREYVPSAGVEKPEGAVPPDRKSWSQTKNFLYYDGTVMPETKEDANEH